jgi:hypothetical protein
LKLSERNAREFLQSKALKTLLGEGYTPATSEIEPGTTTLKPYQGLKLYNPPIVRRDGENYAQKP